MNSVNAFFKWIEKSVSGLIYTLALKVPEGLGLPTKVKDSLDEALLVAEGLPQIAAEMLITASHSAFDNALIAVIWGVVAILVCVSIAIVWIGNRSNRLNKIEDQGWTMIVMNF